jgi:hypothetical protein
MKVTNFDYRDSVFDENNFYGRHALMMINGFATNAYTGQPAFIPEMWGTRADRSGHAASPPEPPVPLRLSPLDTLDGILRDGRQN